MQRLWREADLCGLKKGCKEIGVPEAAAKELVKWLCVKHSLKNDNQAAHRLGGFEPENLEMSLSTLLEKLLQWVLLNVEERNHLEAITGHIHYSTRTPLLSDEEKIAQRLFSMNAMAEVDWKPILALWREEGTIFANIRQYAITSTGDGGEVLVRHCCGEIGLGALMNSAQANEGQQGRKRKREGDDSIVENCAVPESQPAECLPFQIHVKTLTGRTLTLVVKRTHTVASVMQQIQNKDGTPAEFQRLVFAGKYLEASRTLADYNIQEGATFHLVLHVRGC